MTALQCYALGVVIWSGQAVRGGEAYFVGVSNGLTDSDGIIFCGACDGVICIR